ncbi:MAG: glycosyltransferase [Candidatus Thermoplasmatota archaeon]|nr:glycosyltransferase [Candidatus Thermoplasmatota archaeon]
MPIEVRSSTVIPENPSSSISRSSNKLPFISVIIKSYNRSNFLLETLYSVLKQSLDRRYYEVIVVKNYADSKMDQFMEQNSIIVINDNNDLVGHFIWSALNVSHGNILCFLDDDDLFEPSKLKFIFDMFTDREMLYIHNEQSFVNDKGNPINHKIKGISKSLTVALPIKKFKLGKLISCNQDFNCSSMAVRKEVLMLNSSYLSQLEASDDSYIFFQAASFAHGKMYFSSEKLTKYRVHTSETKMLIDGASNYSEYLRSVSNRARRYMAGRETMYLSLQNSTSRVVKKSCLCYFVESKVRAYIYGYKNKLDFSDWFTLLKCSCFQHTKYYLTLVFVALSTKINRQWTLKRLFENDKKRGHS